jgi:hypothetical protein
MPTETLCCGKPAVRAKSSKTGRFHIRCTVCTKEVSEETPDLAVTAFEKVANRSKTATPAATIPQITTAVVALPQNPTELPQYMAARIDDVAELSIPFVARDKPALIRLIKNNVRHVMQRSRDDSKVADVWKSREGQESIIYAFEEAMGLGAELGKMGSLVPYGKVVEFIPAVEAYEFALCNGGNPTFRWIMIDMIHKNDIHDISRQGGVFQCTVNPGVPRGKLIAVAVYGHNNRLGHVIGEVYDAERLLEKALHHSQSYRYYLQDKAAFAMARTEGLLKTEGGREYTTRVMYTKGGGSWEKKLFEVEITNPYIGADQPEMMRKSAGKSFLGKYARVRNSEAAMDEMKGTSEKEVAAVITRSIEAAFENVEPSAAPEPGPDPETEAEPPEGAYPGTDTVPEPEEDISDELNELSDEKQEELEIF